MNAAPGQQSSVNNMISNATVTGNNISPSPETSPDPATDSGPEDMQENHIQEPESESNNELQDEMGVNFVKPKSNEKKDKKSKKAEEKRKAKEKAKKEVEAGPYIPGMSSVKPEEQVVASGNVVAQRAEQEALVRVAEEQRARQEREEQLRQQQE